MSKYEETPITVPPIKNLNECLKRASREFDRQVNTWKQMVEVCWVCPVTHGENARSMEDMQAIIDADPVKFQILLSDSVAQVAHFMATDSERFLELVEPRHLTESPYVWVEGELTLESLRPEWDVQEEVAE